jgi:DNA-binding SARP family transcriptional activator
LIRTRGLYPANPATAPENWPWPVRIVTLGRFSIERDTVQLEASGKVQKKPLELLKILISLGGTDIAGGTLCDILWPDSDGDTAQKSFATTLFRLRQMLGDEQALIYRRGNLSLDPRFVWVDTWAFEAIVTDARAAWRVAGEEQLAQELTDRALALYRGDFLPGERDKPWSFALREKLRARFTLKLSTLCGFWEQSGDLQRAIHCYHDALEVDTLSEEFYQQLMLCYHRAGRRAEAINVYERCRKTLAFRLNITPSTLTEEIHNLIKNGL